MDNYIVGTCGHIDHGKTALIRALNGFEGDSTKEEKARGITIDLSFSSMQNGQKNIAFIDVPGHEKLIKNMIAGAFSFDCVLIVISAVEGIMPQTQEHLDILKLLGVPKAIVVLSKSDLVSAEQLDQQKHNVRNFLDAYDFKILETLAVSIYDDASMAHLKELLYGLSAIKREEGDFFRYYIDRVFSPKGMGTVVTGTILGKSLKVGEKLYVCDIGKESKVKSLQVHNQNVEKVDLLHRCAIGLARIDAKVLERGFILSKKGYLRGFKRIDIFFETLNGKKLSHDRNYTLYIGAKKLEVKVLLFNLDTIETRGYAQLKCEDALYTIFNEKLILREGNQTIAGGKVLNPIADPMRKKQRYALLEALNKHDFTEAYRILITVHKKGFGLISASQRFSLSHKKALSYAKKVEACFIDEKALVLYPEVTQELLYNSIKALYSKNQYACLSAQSLMLSHVWASEGFITKVLEELVEQEVVLQEGNLYKNANLTEDFSSKLESIVLNRLKEEGIEPTAPYNIYDQLQIDRKLGDSILKKLSNSRQVIRLQHNIFIEASSLQGMIEQLKLQMKEKEYLDVSRVKDEYGVSRKYAIAYLEYLDKFDEVSKEGHKRYLTYH